MLKASDSYTQDRKADEVMRLERGNGNITGVGMPWGDAEALPLR